MVCFDIRFPLTPAKTPAVSPWFRDLGGLELVDFGLDRVAQVCDGSFPILPVRGQIPLACKGQVSNSSPYSLECDFSCKVFRHTPGVKPNRRLKQVLKSPKWLNPHCSATLMILTPGSRNKDEAFNKRISMRRVATESPNR
jgi:hypothetical protein